ncbi:hypothetical protein J0910_00520 [Nocardiopsis sp. CNT-189]|uniref:hypothetical protein n=1 Tax=Nocardiopsis oceanisediminis TaxID=2816862 RepID=UPI003B2EF424
MALESQIRRATARPSPKERDDTETRVQHLLHTYDDDRSLAIADRERAGAAVMVRRLANRHDCAAACGCARPCQPGSPRHPVCIDPRHASDAAAAREVMDMLGVTGAAAGGPVPPPTRPGPTPPPEAAPARPPVPASLRPAPVAAAPPKAAKQKTAVECGTYAGYQRHLRRREDPCGPCREANRAKPQKADGYASTRRRKPIAHGTERGYRQHLYRGEQTCADCRRAVRDAQRTRKEQAR